MKEKKEFRKNSFIVFSITMISSAINYLCQILLGRLFSVPNYGIINNIFSLILVLNVIGTTSSMLLTKNIADYKKRNKNVGNKIIKITNLLVILILILSIICIVPIKKMFHLNTTETILSIIAIVTSIYPIMYQGVFSGEKKFILLGLYSFILPCLKLIAIILIKFLNIKYQIFSIVSSIVVANIISVILGNLFYKKIKSKSIVFDKKDEKELKKKYSSLLVTNICLSILVNIDVLYLTIFSSSEITGYYCSALMFGKMVYYCANSLVIVLLPSVSKTSNEREKNILLNKTLFYTLVLIIVFLIPVNILKNELLTIVFGEKYKFAIKYMFYASLISVSYSLNTIFVNYYIGVGKYKKIRRTLTTGTIMLCVMLAIIKDNIKLGLITISLCGIIIFLINFISNWSVNNNEKTNNNNAVL